jgi:putative addiction module CopG family antidote
MNVELSPALEKFVDEQVQQGHFASREEVLEAGLARLMLDPEPEGLDASELAEIRRSLAQMRRGEVLDWKQYAAKVRARYRR